MGRRRLPNFGLAVAAVVVLVLMVAAALGSLVLFRFAQERGRHSNDVRHTISRARIAVLDGETAQRGYLIAGDPIYLGRHDAARVAVDVALGEVQLLTADNPSQQARVGRVSELLRERRREQAETFEVRRRGDTDALARLLLVNEGRLTGQHLREALDELDAEEQRLLTERRGVIQLIYWVLVVVTCVSSLVVVLLGAVLLRINRDIRRREELEVSLAEAGVVQTRRARQASMTAAVAVGMSGAGSLRDLLTVVCEAAVQHLDAAFARIWTVSEDGKTLELQASAGQYARIDGAMRRVPIGERLIGRIAAERKPLQSSDVQHDPLIEDQAWAQREQLVAFAGAPIVVEDRLIGVVALFRRVALEPHVSETLAAVASTVGVGIERKRVDAEIRESEEHYRFMADLIPDQVWTAGTDGALRFVNQRVVDYFERPAAQILEEGWPAVVHPDDLATVVEHWTRSLRSGEPYEVEMRLRRGSDGSYRAHLARATAYRDSTGAIEQWFGCNTDISERKRAEQERERLIGALERSFKELDQFAYVASHDLKAPLRGIANLSQWVEEDLGERMTDDSRAHLHLLRSRVARMEALIEGILSYARAGRTVGKIEEVDTRALVQDVISLLASPRDVVIEIPDVMPVMRTERVPLQQMFLNLVGNALKHGRGPDARVEVGVAKAGPHVEFWVRDNGPGIAPEYHDRVWGMFQMLQPRDKVEGTGIGLSIVKKLAESRGGRAWVVSKLGEGASFHFVWPEG